MQSTRLIFEKKSKFDTAFEGKAVENLYFCSQINRDLVMRFYKQIKHFLLLLTMLSAVGYADAQIKVETSETVELMSIISRTAGFREYCMDNGGQYTSDTETWFSAYGQHPTVTYIKELRKNYGISYDAVMSMAVHLDTDGHKVSFTGEKSDLEKRWQLSLIHI